MSSKPKKAVRKVAKKPKAKKAVKKASKPKAAKAPPAKKAPKEVKLKPEPNGGVEVSEFRKNLKTYVADAVAGKTTIINRYGHGVAKLTAI